MLIVVDFWFTKNIGGRRLVGMRWWHVPSEDGGTTWRFEHRGLEDVRTIASMMALYTVLAYIPFLLPKICRVLACYMEYAALCVLPL